MTSRLSISSPPPLSLIFTSAGSLHKIYESDTGAVALCSPCGREGWDGEQWNDYFAKVEQFKQNFLVAPSLFRLIEYRLEKKCKEHGLVYIAPRLTDSIEETNLRKKRLNRAIKTAAQKKRRENMSDHERAHLIAGEIERRHKRQSNETEMERKTEAKVSA